MRQSSQSPAPICYLEIPSPNIEKAGSFYHAVFGWDIKPTNLTANEYWEFSTGEGQLTGGLDSAKEVRDGGVILYLKVANIDSALAKISAQGGSVIRPKFDIGGGYGWSALFRDPNGNTLGLFSTS